MINISDKLHAATEAGMLCDASQVDGLQTQLDEIRKLAYAGL